MIDEEPSGIFRRSAGILPGFDLSVSPQGSVVPGQQRGQLGGIPRQLFGCSLNDDSTQLHMNGSEPARHTLGSLLPDLTPMEWPVCPT
jgi:hypothetical protein